MTTGFVAYNDDDEILVSSETRNLHLIARMSNGTISNSGTAYGGFKEITYTITLATGVIPVPFFTIPDGFVSIAGIKNTGSFSSGDRWEITLIQSGTSGDVPTVYLFADPRAVTSSETHGIQVFMDDGTTAFDSRKSPLAVSGGIDVQHPSNPSTGAISLSDWQCSSGSGHGQFTPNNYTDYAVDKPTLPMFHFSSLAQAERQASFSGYDEDCTGFSIYGVCLGYAQTDAWTSTYWAFYRAGIGVTDQGIRAGWICVLGGCYWSSWSDSGFFGIDELFGNDSSSSGGFQPYSNQTINTQPQALIIADAGRYGQPSVGAPEDLGVTYQ